MVNKKYLYKATIAIGLSKKKKIEIKKYDWKFNNNILIFVHSLFEDKEFKYIEFLLKKYNNINLLIHYFEEHHKNFMKNKLKKYNNRITFKKQDIRHLIKNSDIAINFEIDFLHNIYNQLENDCFNTTPFYDLISIKDGIDYIFQTKDDLFFNHIPKYINFKYEINEPIDLLKNLFYDILDEETITYMYTEEDLKSQKRFNWIMDQCIKNKKFRERQKKLHKIIFDYNYINNENRISNIEYLIQG